ncbi:hypothetical protein [Hymenobacter nivis]|uniref:Uncharacterized protein n=1 Tax=Hymenobacter nivis TaxID=1850093 RepID=A0A502GB43_9BACT|nr:hypothetical protein [Hymenobacter nivis]TPG59457.1 hypothetical protein EAH73_21320 [Hymenobacter nivis]
MLVAFLVVMPLLTWAQHTVPAPGAPTTARELVHKTFLIGYPDAAHPPAPEDRSYFIFQPDGRAVYRGTRGVAVQKDSPLGWRVAGDSLFLTPGAVTLEAAGQTQRIARAVVRYAVTKVPGGYLLRRNAEQTLLTEVK